MPESTFPKDGDISNPVLHETFLRVVDNQLRANDPPETRETFDRLLADGYSELDARKLIAGCVVCEVHRILRTKTEFDRDRYVRMLADLPGKLPFDVEEIPADPKRSWRQRIFGRRESRSSRVGVEPQPIPERIEERFPSSVRRRMYWSSEAGGTFTCPVCGTGLVSEHHVYEVHAIMGDFADDFLVGSGGGHFCPECPTVVLDGEDFREKLRLADVPEDAQLLVPGIVDLNAIPLEKRDVPLGEDDNPVPLVYFTDYAERLALMDDDESPAPPPVPRKTANQRKRERKRLRKRR